MTHLQVSRAEVADDCLVLIRVPALRLQQHICLVQRSLVWLVIARVRILLCRSLLLDLQSHLFSACSFYQHVPAMRFQQHGCLTQSSLVRLVVAHVHMLYCCGFLLNLHMTYSQQSGPAVGAHCHMHAHVAGTPQANSWSDNLLQLLNLLRPTMLGGP